MQSRRVVCLGEGITGFCNERFENGWKLSLLKGSVKNREDINNLPIKVPGNVRMALMQHGIIKDPFVGRNNEGTKWISDSTWKYSNHLDISNLKNETLDRFPNGGFIHLIFDGIDYDASFFIDNKEITRQTGMFSPIDLILGITPDNDTNNDEGDFNVEVIMHRQPSWRTHALKCQMAFGWDFAPEIRTIGIWNHVRTQITGPIFFTECFPRIKHLNSENIDVVNLCIDFRVAAYNPENLSKDSNNKTLEMKIAIGDETYTRKIVSQPSKTQNVEIKNISLPLWWSHTLGNQPLIPITIQLSHDGITVDEYRGKIANRKIEWGRNPGTWPKNENWTFTINNKKQFVRGINWVPPDSLFGRISTQKYQKLIDHCIDLNIDMIRVWGGGIEEKSAFYDYCDKKGVLVWQEFPFACTNYPKFKKLIALAKNECESMTKRTRRHPSVVVYCGGNEFNPFINNHIIKIVKNAVAKYAADRYCFAVSPYLGDDHNWRVWGMGRGFGAYEANSTGIFQMLTEYGYQAAPSIETLKQCVDEKVLEKILKNNNQTIEELPIEDVREYCMYHKGDINNHIRYAQKFDTDIKTVGDLIKVSQQLQSYALKYAIEVCRSSWPNVSGVFPWQLNDPWPNISWSLVDYNLRKKLAYKMVKKSYSPVLPMVRNWKRSKKGKHWRIGDIIVHNASQKPLNARLEVNISYKDKTDKIQKQLNTAYNSPIFTVSPNRPLKIGEIETKAIAGNKIILNLFDESDNLILSNFHFPAMEPMTKITDRIREWIDARFDGWWRTYMTKLMELERLREEDELWKQIQNGKKD